MLGLGDLIRWAVRQIRQRFLESLMIILGIALGIAVICGVISMVSSYQRAEQDKAESIWMRTFYIQNANHTQSFTDAENPLNRLEKVVEGKNVAFDDYLQIREAEVEGIEYIWLSEMITEPLDETKTKDDQAWYGSVEERVAWVYGSFLQINPVTPEVFDLAELRLVKGDLIRDSDVFDKNRVTVIGDELATYFFGDADPIGQTITLRNGSSYTVIGVVHRDVYESKNSAEWREIPFLGVEHHLNKHMFIPYFSHSSSPEPDKVLRILALPKSDVNLQTASNYLRTYLNKEYNGALGFWGNFIRHYESSQVWVSISKLVGILACGALLIASINILNLMMARVLRRYKQIGISMALGASRRDLFNLFLAESVILGGIGSGLGLMLAHGGLILLGFTLKIPMSLTLFTAVIGVGLAFLTTLIFGLYPAMQASKVQPVDALKAD